MIDKSGYENIEIPGELDQVVQDALAEGLEQRRKNRVRDLSRRLGPMAAVFLLCTVTALNISPTFAAAACDLPVVGGLCQVFLFREYHKEDDIKYIDAKIPQIKNTGKTELEQRINQEIQKAVYDRLAASAARAKDYHDAFIATGGDAEAFVPVGITIDYEVKYISPSHVSFVISQYESRFSSYHCEFYYNIDLGSGKVITLKDWFGPSYQQIVADSIEESIAQWSDEQRGILWEHLSIPDLISEDTNFYFDRDGQVVVVIEKYQAAYGAAGSLEFKIG